ncbi:putative uncharacterized protein FRMD6-AS1 [Mustela lutreola]|uniref:putative uncharacterized protein FRMD6-AS1 n=1 Tax=Mustela lutreola TaxID=9666 RepID=UPI002797846E|nr:putative uncharacterized protein FRMD6-AS1 [Mustela lutreola]
MGRNRQAPPEQGAGDHRGTERGTVSPRRSPQPRSASRPRRTGGPRAPRLPRCLARLPRGPVLPPRCGRALPVERRPSSPVPDAQSGRSKKKAKKDAEKETLLWLGLSTRRNLPKVPSSRRRRRPAGRGHSGQPGRRGRARGSPGRPPGAEFPLVPRRKPGAPGVGLSSAPQPLLLAPRQPGSSQPLCPGSQTSAFPHATEAGGDAVSFPLLAEWPSLTLGPRSPGTLPPEPSRAGRGWLFGLGIVLLIRNDGVEATQRGGDPSGGGFVTPSFSPLLLSRTHRPTHHSGRALVGFYTGWRGRRQEAKPPPLTLVSAIVKVDTASICCDCSECDPSEILFVRPRRWLEGLAEGAKGRWKLFLWHYESNQKIEEEDIHSMNLLSTSKCQVWRRKCWGIALVTGSGFVAFPLPVLTLQTFEILRRMLKGFY